MKIGRAETMAARAACFAIRRAVFIEEQNIPEAEEWDAHDATCRHYLAQDTRGPAATARLIRRDGTDGPFAKIGRVAVLRARRGTGLGARIMGVVLEDARTEGLKAAELEAQVAVIAFYERLGFVAVGPEYDDGSGILHRLMRRGL